MSWFTVALCLGAALRIWRVYDVDDIGQPLRNAADWLSERGPDWVTILFSCIYCLGFYLCVGLVTLGYFFGDTAWFIIPTASLSVSFLLGELYNRVEEAPSER